MITLPSQNKQWVQASNSDLFGNVYVTKNISFDEEGYLRLSYASKACLDENTDSDFNLPTVIIPSSDYGIFIQTTEEPFSMNVEPFTTTPTQIVTSGVPNGDPQAGATYFEGNLVVTDANDVDFYRDINNDWIDTDISLTATTGSQHQPVNFVSFSSIAIANVNTVGLYSNMQASPTLTRTLTIPSDFYITGMAYFNQNLYIGTRNNSGQKAYLFVWNGEGTAAQSAYEVDANAIIAVTMFQDSIVILSSSGALLRFNGSGFTTLAAFPVFYTTRSFTDELLSLNMFHNTMKSNNDVIYLSVTDVGNNEHRLLNQPDGIWCYDPKVGLYHKYSFSNSIVVSETIATNRVDTGDDTIVLSSLTVPATGTEVIYYDDSGTTLGGLTDEQKYYVIRVNSTTLKLATTRANAEAGTAVDLTGTGNSLQKLIFFPRTDYGQFSTTNRAGALMVIEAPSPRTNYGTDVVWGAELATRANLETNNAIAGTITTAAESRGYIITPKYFSDSLTDVYNNIIIKYGRLGELDKIIVKYRTVDDDLDEVDISGTTSWKITWTSATTFTTTVTDWANASVGDEVEVLVGAGAGLLAHITAIVENGGTYGITIDESFTDYTAGDIAKAIFRNWTKIMTITSADELEEQGFKKIEAGRSIAGKFIQLKIELRGIGTKIEQIMVDNRPLQLAQNAQ